MKKTGLILFAGGIVNFLLFFVFSNLVGGNALSGKVEDGRYYVSNRGRRTEVSRTVWHLSRAHTISLFITHPLAIFGIAAFGMSLKTARRVGPPQG